MNVTRPAGIALAIALSVSTAHEASGWERSINGRPGSDRDDALCVAVDALTGSVFVGGSRQVTATDTAFVIMKLRADGQTEWRHVVRGTGPVGLAAAVAVDPVGGFVFAAGVLLNAAGEDDLDSDLIVVKFDGRARRKRVLWTRIISVPGVDHDVAALALTPDGGVALAGKVASDRQQFYLTKLTANGDDAWPAPQIFAGTATSGINGASAITVLPNGDVAVTGTVANAVTNHDLAIGRFDGATGERRWFLSVNGGGPFNGDDFGAAVRVAPDGDLVVAGTLWMRNGFDNVAVLRLDGAGGLRWQRTINVGDDSARTVAVAPDGSIVAGGVVRPSAPNGSGQSSFFAVKLRADGVELWRHETPGPDAFGEVRDIAFDGAGHPVLTGLAAGTDALGVFLVVALDPDTGTIVWQVPILGTTPFLNEGRALVVDPVRNAVIAVGVTQNNLTSFDMTVTRITDGHEDWRRVITGHGKRRDRNDGASALAADPRTGSVFVAGSAQNTGTGVLGGIGEFRIVKLRQSGSVAWKYDLRAATPHTGNRAQAVAVAPNGDVFGAGLTGGTDLTSSFTVVRVSRFGSELWRAIIPGAVPGRDRATSLAVDPRDGHLLVAGQLQQAGGPQLALLKLNAITGMVLWSVLIGEGADGGVANTLALTGRGTVAVGGTLSSVFTVLEVDTMTGAVIWTAQLPGRRGAPGSLAIAPDGSIVAAGSTRIGQQFNASSTVATFEADGTPRWTALLGEAGPLSNTGAGAVAVHPDTGAIAVSATVSSPGGLLWTITGLNPADGTAVWRTADILGQVNAVAFAGHDVIAIGRVREPDDNLFAVVAFTSEGAEVWRRTFQGTADFGTMEASLVTVDPLRSRIVAGGVINNVDTSTDMFVVGLSTDGSDLTRPRSQTD